MNTPEEIVKHMLNSQIKQLCGEFGFTVVSYIPLEIEAYDIRGEVVAYKGQKAKDMLANFVVLNQNEDDYDGRTG